MFLIAAVGIVPLAMLERRLDFQRISIIEICSVQASVVTSIVLAIAGLDAEAYVLGTIAGTAVWAILLVILGPSAFPRWHPRQMREIARFGLPAGLAGTAQVGYGNIDFLVLGGTLSRGQRRLLLSRVRARRPVPGQDQRDHHAAGLPGLLARGGHGAHA